MISKRNGEWYYYISTSNTNFTITSSELMTGREWYRRFLDEYEKQYENLVAQPTDVITYIDTVKAAFKAAQLASGIADE